MSRFSETLLDHSRHPRNAEPMPHPDAVGMASHHGSPPHIVLFLYLDQQSVREARFQATGCGVAIACASVLTELLRGRTLQECRRLQLVDLIEALGGIPPTKRFCAELAHIALQNALASIPSTESAS